MLFKKEYTLYDKLSDFFNSSYNEKNFLFFFRIAVCLVAMIEFASLAADLPLFFSSFNTLIPQELMYLQTEYFKYLHGLYQFIEAQHLTPYFYSGIIYTYVFSLLFLLIGLFTRFAACVALTLQLIIFKSFSNFNYGYDNFLTMSIFYCLVFPVGKYYSLDSKIFKFSQKIHFNYRRVLQVHLATAYFFSGIAKGLDVGWWNGNSVWKAVASVDGELYSLPPLFLAIGSISTVMTELLYPFLVMKNNTRKYIVAAIILMHTGIAIMMNLFAFSAIMIVWNIAAFGNISIKEKTTDASIAV